MTETQGSSKKTQLNVNRLQLRGTSASDAERSKVELFVSFRVSGDNITLFSEEGYRTLLQIVDKIQTYTSEMLKISICVLYSLYTTSYCIQLMIINHSQQSIGPTMVRAQGTNVALITGQPVAFTLTTFGHTN